MGKDFREQYLMITSYIQNRLLFPVPHLHSKKFNFTLIFSHCMILFHFHHTKIQPLHFMPVYPIYTRKVVSNVLH